MKPIKPTTRPEVIEKLEYLLEMAKRGEIRSLAVALTLYDWREEGQIHKHVHNDTYAMIGMVECLKLHLHDGVKARDLS